MEEVVGTFSSHHFRVAFEDCHVGTTANHYHWLVDGGINVLVMRLFGNGAVGVVGAVAGVN